MTEAQDAVHLHSIEAHILAMADHTQAMLESTTKLKRSVEDSTRLLRQIFDLLPPLPNQNQSTAISCVQSIEISRALEEHESFVDSNEISRNGTIAAAQVFDQMPQRLDFVPTEISTPVDAEPVCAHKYFLLIPHQSLVMRYYDFSDSMLITSDTLKFSFDDSAMFVALAKFLGVPTGLKRSFWNSMFPIMWVMIPTHGFNERKSFDPGIATSLLFSAFESWLVAEHFKRGFDPQWLSVTFSKAIFLGNGLVAIIFGLFGTVLVDTLALGPVAPFDAAACFLAIGMAIIMSTWGENYGDPSENKDLLTQFKGAAVAIASDEKIALLGAIQSLFDGSMYTFVFLWTPALSPNGEEIPHGFIFATFMLASMLGSSIASRLMARASLRVESYMQIVFLVSAASLLLPVITSFFMASTGLKGGSISFSGCIQLGGFCAFESCVGIFWPSILKMRSQYIPEEARSTIMNFFRVPLNIFVCVVLYNVDAFPMVVMFGMCSIFLFVAFLLQRRLMIIAETQRSKSQDWMAMKEREVEAEPLTVCFGSVKPSIDTSYAYGSSSLRTRMFSRGR